MYVGSFWSQPLRYVANRELFEAEQVLKEKLLVIPFHWVFFFTQGDLFSDLQGLPRFSTMRKMNDLIKRARSAKVHFNIENICCVILTYNRTLSMQPNQFVSGACNTGLLSEETDADLWEGRWENDSVQCGHHLILQERKRSCWKAWTKCLSTSALSSGSP